MRVIAGALRGRALQAPPGLRVRPTSDALRETLFNVCGPRVAGSVWVDCCAGSGAVGIEALSRGAAAAFFIEPARAARTALQANLRRLGLDEAPILARPAPAVLAALAEDARWSARGCDFFFLDPPYGDASLYAAVLGRLGGADCGLLAAEAWVIVEHARRADCGARHGRLERFRLLEQGDSSLSFYRLAGGAIGAAGLP
ncbi:MAG: 16S rRNA (guanine(966)-N(2))-methyltransferase RsmD [Terriglobales bacterium]